MAEEVPEVQAELVDSAPRSSAAEKRKRRNQSLFESVFRQTLLVVSDSMHFSEIDQDCTKPPDEWVQKLGARRAEQRLRIARASWMSPKEAPVGIMVAKAFAGMAIRAQAIQASGTPTLNVAVLQMSAPMPEFARKVLEEPK